MTVGLGRSATCALIGDGHEVALARANTVFVAISRRLFDRQLTYDGAAQ